MGFMGIDHLTNLGTCIYIYLYRYPHRHQQMIQELFLKTFHQGSDI